MPEAGEGNAKSQGGPLALVLSGGGARGAYEIGVLRFVLHELVPRLGPTARPRIFCGTSVGAINGCAMAAHAQLPDFGIQDLCEVWEGLRLSHVFSLGWGDLAGLARWMFGASAPGGPQSLVDAAPLAELVRRVVPWRSLHQNLAERLVDGVSVSATDVENGRSVVFLETRDERDYGPPTKAFELHPARLTSAHALASAAIPIVFPTVRVGGRIFSDGSLRQNTPIAPALRLGAERVLVIGLRASGPERGGRQQAQVAQSVSSPLYLFGKLLDALLLDRVESDLASLRRINAALAALDRSRLNPAERAPVEAALAALGANMRIVSDLFIRPSTDLGKLAAEVLQRPVVRARLAGPMGYLLRRMGESEDGDPSDLLSYLLFDGEYAHELIAQGERDAREREAELVRFLL